MDERLVGFGGEGVPEIVHDQANLIRIRIQLATTFTPSGPVSDRELFAGRLDQISRALTAVSQVGQHVVLYGERGVGKTSFARLIDEFWNDVASGAEGLIPIRYNCDSKDKFEDIWSNIAEMIKDEAEKRDQALPTGESWKEVFSAVRQGEATPHTVRRLLDLAGLSFIVVIDEFDQLSDEETVHQFSSTIKGLADNLIDTTLMLVGVADTVDDLIAEHASIDRNLAQILMPRMSRQELVTIIETGYNRVGLTAAPGVLDLMSRLAQGLPHYAHRFAQEAGYAAIGRKSLTVERQDVDEAVNQAVELTHESIQAAYHHATVSPQKEALFDKVLLACALPKPDELNYFTARDVRGPLEHIVKRRLEIPQFVGHLKKFCGQDKGPVLQMSGEEWKRRYRFINPLMRPYVVLRGIREGLIDEDAIKRFSEGDEETRESGEQRPLPL